MRTFSLAHLFVICEQIGMDNAPGTMELAEKAGISKSYASEIANGKRDPSRSLAIHIYRTTGWKPSPISALSEPDIDMLERIERSAA